MIIGITGGTGSGKTTLLHLLEQQGVLVLDCDAIYHELLTSSPALLAAIESRFPGTVEGGRLQRKKLGTIVFSDETALHDLNKITHSAIHAEVRQRLESHPAHAAIDAIALFEGGLAELADTTVAVCAPEGDRVRRLMNRDGISEEYARNRIRAQKHESWFREMCAYTLYNNGTREEFEEQCREFLERILK